MANRIALVILVIALLPLFVAPDTPSECTLVLSQRLAQAGRKFNTFSATLRNTGAHNVKNIAVSTSDKVKSIDNTEGASSLPIAHLTIDGGDSWMFTYTKSGSSPASFTVSCDVELPVVATSAPDASTEAVADVNVEPFAKSKATTAPTKSTSGSSKATSAPSKGSSSKLCSSSTWWRPQPMTTWQWQLTGKIDTSLNVQMYDIDLFDNTATTISTLHSQGRVVICYFSTQYENWRPDASSFTSAVLGNNLGDWAGEKYVDIRSSVVRNIMTARMDLAVSKGCDGLEPDNVDGYTANTGFPIKAADQLNFNEFIAAQAHARGLSVGLKNDLGQAKTLEPFFDWALNEQCNQFSECSSLNAFVQNNKAVFNAEYSGSAASFCPKMNTAKISSLLKTLDLTASVKAQCCTYLSGGCTSAPSTCGSSTSKRSLDQEETFDTLVDVDAPVDDNTVIAEPVGASSASVATVSLFACAMIGLLGLNL